MKTAQSTSKVLMIRPGRFRFNEETAVNNYYQVKDGEISAEMAHQKAMEEFDALVGLLRRNDVEVMVKETPHGLDVPDALFPNNWISFHEGNEFVLYSMYAPNRRKEREIELGENALREKHSFTRYEKEGKFLEGTGSLVLDRKNSVAYAAISPRTDAELVKEFGKAMDYDVVLFSAFQSVGEKRLLIYHTNVMMSIGEQFVWICADCIDDKEERENVLRSLSASGREVIILTEDQVEKFAGNILEVKNKKGKAFIVMSARAFHSLQPSQIESLGRYGEILHTDLDTIETLGGGSARCMIAEIF